MARTICQGREAEDHRAGGKRQVWVNPEYKGKSWDLGASQALVSNFIAIRHGERQIRQLALNDPSPQIKVVSFFSPSLPASLFIPWVIEM